MSCWLSNFMIGQVTPVALEAVKWRFYILFSITAVTNALTMWLLFPETKSRTLEEMDAYFEKTHWIVPLSKDVPSVSTRKREDELRRGVVYDGGNAVKVVEPATEVDFSDLQRGQPTPTKDEKETASL